VYRASRKKATAAKAAVARAWPRARAQAAAPADRIAWSKALETRPCRPDMSMEGVEKLGGGE
jgi:hypothetical protein